MNEVSAGYFSALGTRLLQGRDFAATDQPGTTQVAIVTETFARHFFGAQNPVGKTYRIRMGDEKSPPVEIIGIVEDTKYNTLREDRQAIAYVASSQQAAASNRRNFEIALAGSASSIMPMFADLVKQVHPRALIRFTPLAEQVDESITRERLLATLSGFFGGLALLLAIIGLYGVISYTMARRRNEIGIRIALGSARNRILRLVLSEVAQIVVLGLAAGTVLVLVSTRLIAALLYGVAPTDAGTILGSAALLAAAALLAGLLPAVRAARLDPMLALRDE
jgi:ABC-type antimicrobial peptide transport system permease subunit